MADVKILLTLDNDPPVITIRRDPGVNDLFWIRLRGEVAAQNSATDNRIQVPAETLLANRSVMRALCVQFRVGLTADEGCTTLLRRAVAEEDELRVILQQPPDLHSDEILKRLNAGRFRRELRPFQTRDLSRLLALPHGANFSVPGAGKTTVAYATYEAERVHGRVERMLVVAPLSAFDAWMTEVDECFETSPVVGGFSTKQRVPANVEILLINYQKLLNPAVYAHIIDWVSRRPCHVILDEAHRMKKGRAGAWGTACLDLAWYAERRDILTGTPAPQHPGDLEALLDFVWPSQGRRVLPDEAFAPAPPPGAGRRVADAIRPLFVRTRKSELGLDEPVKRVLRIELHGLHREIYLALVNQYSGRIPLLRRDRYRLAEMRKVIMYLLEAATNPALLPLGSSPHDPPVFEHPRAPIPAGSTLVDLLNEYGKYDTPAKFRKLGELLRVNAEQGRKTLVWSNFVRNLELLKRDLARYQPAMIHGGVPSEVTAPTTEITREMELARFRDDSRCMVLLANPAAMSEGVSLHKVCHDAIYLERTFNAGQFLQSIDRIHRLGLADDVQTTITFFITANTIDEVVHERVSEKAARLGDMLNDPDITTMALPDENDLEDVDSGFGRPVDDPADVAALFAHLRGEDGD